MGLMHAHGCKLNLGWHLAWPPPQALVDAPGQARRVVNFKRMSLTDFVVDIPRLASKKVVTAKFAESGGWLPDTSNICISWHVFIFVGTDTGGETAAAAARSDCCGRWIKQSCSRHRPVFGTGGVAL